MTTTRTLRDFEAYENGQHYATALTKLHGPRALIGEAERLQARGELAAFIEGFADEAVHIATLVEARETRQAMERATGGYFSYADRVRHMEYRLQGRAA